MTDGFDQNNVNHGDSEPTGSDEQLQGAFDRLRNDAAKVNTMAALQQHDNKKTTPPWYASPGILVGSLAAIALLVVGGIFVLGGDDPIEGDVLDTATPSPGPTPGGDPIPGIEPFVGDWILTVGVAQGQEFYTGIEVQGQGTLTIDGATGNIGGTAFCNGYGGQINAIPSDDGTWTGEGPNVPIFSEMGQNQMGCEQSLMQAESTFLGALGATNSMTINENGELELAGDGVSLTFERRADVPTSELVGTTWVLDTIVLGGGALAQSTTAGADPATLLFDTDGTFTGSTGCRIISGDWIETDGGIAFPSWGAEGDCPEEFTSQDGNVIAILEGNLTVEIEGDQLTLTSQFQDALMYRAATDADAGPGDPDIEGTWKLESAVVDGVELVPGVDGSNPDILLTFNAGRVSGNDDCNDFSGTFTQEGSGIAMTDFGGTMEGCDFSETYQATLQAVNAVALDVGPLMLLTHDQLDIELVYVAYVEEEPTPTPVPDPSIPAATTFADLPCGESGPAGDDATSVNTVTSIVSYEEPGCRRTVFTLASTEGDVDTISSDSEVLSFETPLGGGLNVIPVAFPLTVNFEATEDRTAGWAGQAQKQDGLAYLHVNHGGAGNTNVTVLSNPPRIVADTFTTVDDLQPVLGTNVILPRELNEGGPGRTMPMTVTGHARPFEAQGAVSLREAPAPDAPPGSGALVTATWTDGGIGALPPVVSDSRYGYRALWEAWGEFSFTIDDLPPGDYELQFENDQADEGDLVALHAYFTVLDDGSSPTPAPVTTAEVLLEQGGFTVTPADGTPIQVAFGDDEDKLAGLESVLGTATLTNQTECGSGTATIWNYADAGITVDVDANGFVQGWTSRTAGHVTEQGVGVGSTLAAIQTQHEVQQLVGSTLGNEYYEANTPTELGRTFFADGTGPDSTITLIKGGSVCSFR